MLISFLKALIILMLFMLLLHNNYLLHNSDDCIGIPAWSIIALIIMAFKLVLLSVLVVVIGLLCHSEHTKGA